MPNPTVEIAPGRTMRHALRGPAVLLLLAFAVAVLLPLAATDFRGGQRLSATEKRALAEFPKWSWDAGALDAFPARFEAAFNDRFGFRAPLVAWQSRVKVRALGVPSTPGVVLGRDGWLYLAETVKEARGVVKTPPAEAEAWARYLAAKQAWLGAHGIAYLFVIVPNKERVYPEYLPENLCAVGGARFSDQLVARLGREPGLEFLDLRSVLLNAKPRGLIFERTDTHWSQLGAFLAANAILERLRGRFPELHAPPLPDDLAEVTGPGGDLAVMLGLPGELTERRQILTAFQTAFHSAPMRLEVEWPTGSYHELPRAFEANDAGLQHTLLLGGNSFTTGLLDFLPAHFRRVVRVRPVVPYPAWFQALTPRLVEAEKPDVVLDVLSERHLRKAPRWELP